jgi:spore maturation protein CgeB
VRILVAGDWHSDLHESELCNSLHRLGHEVIKFKWHNYFEFNIEKPYSILSIYKRLQNKYLVGPLISHINKEFIKVALYSKPQIIFIYRGTHILTKTLRFIKLRMPFTKIVGYCNDDPFSPLQSSIYWRHFKRSIYKYDLILAYRHRNLEDFKIAGSNNVTLLRSWYVPDRNFPVELKEDEKNKYECDIVFIGHYENDNRLEFLESIVEKGYKLRIYGPSKDWKLPLTRSKILSVLGVPNMVWGQEYNKALCGARIALCFFSKLNRDTYTRRCFEIPATCTLLLSEYSDDLASLYQEGVEADFFRSKSEMLEKIKFYTNNSEIADKVAAAGYVKVKNSGHDIDSRIRKILEIFQ